MKLKTFNFVASLVALFLGTAYVLSDGASIDANVIGASGGSGGLTSIIGLVMIIGAIGLFIASMHAADEHTINLERLVRRTKNHQELTKQEDEIEKK